MLQRSILAVLGGVALTGCGGGEGAVNPNGKPQLHSLSASTEIGVPERKIHNINYEEPTHADVMAFTKRAKEHYLINGKYKALDDFMDPSSQFVAGRMYVFAFDYKGNLLADWGNPNLVGKNLLGWHDSTDKPFFMQASEKALDGGGWVATKWNDPLRRAPRMKDCYVMNVDDNIFIGSGVYR